MAKLTSKDINAHLAKVAGDPLGWVYSMFPWQQPGTVLADEEGPDDWQADILEEIGRQLKTRQTNALGAIQIAVASGHGVGKSCLVAWLILWFISTRKDPNIVVTANTLPQLSSKTWREVRKWKDLCIVGHWFAYTATSLYMKGAQATWSAKAIPWSKEKPEAFAGTHGESVLVIFDEASAIEDIIWETTEGAMTDTEAMWICFGNPTRNDGRFRQCWGKFRHRWLTRQVDSRKCRKPNKKQINQWIDDYGEDSDFVRIRVRGVFPRSGSQQFISSELVEEAQRRSPAGYEDQPIILGCDLAYSGDNQTVLVARQGVATLGIRRFRELEPMQVVGVVSKAIREYDPDATIIDIGGFGAGVCDRLQQLGYDITALYVGGKALDKRKYFNLRAEMWGNVVDWLQNGGCLPRDDQELADDLVGPLYGFDHLNRFQLEKKQDMKARGLDSPDSGDALALTLALPVVQKKPRKPKKIEIRQQTFDEMLREHDLGLPNQEDTRI